MKSKEYDRVNFAGYFGVFRPYSPRIRLRDTRWRLQSFPTVLDDIPAPAVPSRQGVFLPSSF